MLKDKTVCDVEEKDNLDIDGNSIKIFHVLWSDKFGNNHRGTFREDGLSSDVQKYLNNQPKE